MEHPLRLEPEAEIAGFLQRIFAALIDALLLCLVILFGLLPLFGWYAPETTLAVSGASLLYFSFFNSRLGGGATLGKRILGVRVVDRTGSCIGFFRAVWRSAVDILPGALGSLLPALLPSADPLSSTLGNAFAFGFLLASLFLYVFNTDTRQVLHDLAAGTFVVRQETATNPFHRKTPRLHILAAIAVIAVTVGIMLSVSKLQQKPAAPCETQIMSAVRSLPFADRVTMQSKSFLSKDTNETIGETIVVVFAKRGDPSLQARAAARKVLTACPTLKNRGILEIILASHPKTYSLIPKITPFPATVEEWRKSLDEEKREKGRQRP